MKKPHTEISLHGEGAEEVLALLRSKYQVQVLKDETIAIEETEYWRSMQENRQGNLLAAARLRAGLTQKQLAETLKVRQSMVSEMERGKRKLSEQMIQRLSGALNIPPQHFAR